MLPVYVPMVQFSHDDTPHAEKLPIAQCTQAAGELAEDAVE
jgi:hypothetical protein